MHGGYGFTDEFPVSRFYRGARYGTLGGGTTETLKELVGKKHHDATFPTATASSAWGRSDLLGSACSRHTARRPHQSATKLAMTVVTCLMLSRSTNSSKPCEPVPEAP